MSPPARVQLPPGGQKLPRRKLSAWEFVFRLLNLLLIVGALALAWWSYNKRLVPLRQQSRAVSTALAKLAFEVDLLERRWPKSDRDQIRADYKESRNQLFADEAELGRWLVRLEEEASPLALDLNVNFGKSIAQTKEQEKLAIVPASVTLEIRPVLGGTQTPYQRMLKLGQQLAAEGKRADLSELDVNGGPLSITHGLLIFNLWAGEGK